MQTNINLCKKLEKQIGIFTPSSSLAKDRTEMAYKNLSSLSLDFNSPIPPYQSYGKYEYGFSNASSIDRLNSINHLINDSNVDVLLASRGGTGSLDIISEFPYDRISKARKLLIGQSDVSALLVQMPFKSNIPAIHGPTLGAEFADYDKNPDAKSSIDTLLKLLTDPKFQYSIEGDIIKQGKEREGILLAGNLTMLATLLGTPWDIDYDNAILIVEEVGEPPYKVERLLMQLYLAGKFEKLSALCFGRFAKCESKHGPCIEEVINNFTLNKLDAKEYMVYKNLPVGHWGKNMPVPIGCKGLTKTNKIEILESPIL